MRNEKGITLIELLAALAIVGIITAVISSVLLTGTSSADRTTSKQTLQQEANYIVEVIRSEYLKKDTEDLLIIATTDTLKIKRDKVGESEKVISEGFTYKLESKVKIDPSINEQFHMILKDGKEEYVIKTTFSKLR